MALLWKIVRSKGRKGIKWKIFEVFNSFFLTNYLMLLICHYYQVKSLSPEALSASVNDIGSFVRMIDRIAGSAPGNGSRAAVGEDLVAMTKCRLQARNFITQDGMAGTKKMRRYTSAMPLNVVSSAGSMNDSFKQLTGSETSDLESTATSSIKRTRVEVFFYFLYIL